MEKHQEKPKGRVPSEAECLFRACRLSLFCLGSFFEWPISPLIFPSHLLFFFWFYSIGQLTPLIIEYIYGEMQAGLRVPSGQEIRGENKEGDFFFQSLLEDSKLIL